MTKTMRQMVQHDSAGGLLLIFMALIAILIANSPLNHLYAQLLSIPVKVGFNDFEINKPFILWINDGLMALFFFLVGLEVKREILAGTLKSTDQVILPAVAAIGGIAFPAIFYFALNSDSPEQLQGWAVPSATDIAFALGVFSLFGRTLPIALKLFLLSVAIFDDIGAIIIIALFYSEDLSTISLVIALLGLSILFLFNLLSVRIFAAYVLIGLLVWVSVLKSGVHATLAGFLVALFIPLNVKNDHGESILESVEHNLQPWIAFMVLPLFAFANAGVSLGGLSWPDITDSVTLGIIAGLFLGKQIGVFGLSWLIVQMRWAKLPKGATWLQFYGVSLLCGIGFTMSLFIGTLAFENSSSDIMTNVKLGVLIGSLLSAVTGALVIRYCNTLQPKETT